MDETWRRFLASLPVGRAVVKLGYAFERGAMEPAYMHPFLLESPEPADDEIAQRLGAITLAAADTEENHP